MSRPVQILALDLGGVVVDVDHARCARALGLDRAQLDHAFFSAGVHDDLTSGACTADAFVAAAAVRLGRSQEEVRAAWADVVAVTEAGFSLVADVLAAGHAVHLWTNTDPIHLARLVATLPAGVVTMTASCVLGAVKPDARYWQLARAAGEPTLFIDDRADNVAAAAAAGVRAHRCHGALEARAVVVDAGLL